MEQPLLAQAIESVAQHPRRDMIVRFLTDLPLLIADVENNVFVRSENGERTAWLWFAPWDVVVMASKSPPDDGWEDQLHLDYTSPERWIPDLLACIGNPRPAAKPDDESLWLDAPTHDGLWWVWSTTAHTVSAAFIRRGRFGGYEWSIAGGEQGDDRLLPREWKFSPAVPPTPPTVGGGR